MIGHQGAYCHLHSFITHAPLYMYHNFDFVPCAFCDQQVYYIY